MPFLVKKVLQVFSWSWMRRDSTCLEDKERVERKWVGEEAIFNCINNQSFLFGHEKILGMGKKGRRQVEW